MHGKIADLDSAENPREHGSEAADRVIRIGAADPNDRREFTGCNKKNVHYTDREKNSFPKARLHDFITENTVQGKQSRYP